MASKFKIGERVRVVADGTRSAYGEHWWKDPYWHGATGVVVKGNVGVKITRLRVDKGPSVNIEDVYLDSLVQTPFQISVRSYIEAELGQT